MDNKEKPDPAMTDTHSSVITAQNREIEDLKHRLAETTEALRTTHTDLLQEQEKRATIETQLKKSEENYLNVVENALDSIFIVQDGMIKYCNQALIELTGYTWEELSTRSFDFIIHPEDREMVSDRHQRRLLGENVKKEYTLRLISKTGQTIWAYLRAAKIVTWQDQPATLGFLTDVTERITTERALKESEEQYRLFIEKMPNGFSQSRVILDENNQPVDFTFLDVNEIFLKSTQLKKEDIIGIPITTVIPEVLELKPDLTEVSGRVALQGDNFQGELYFRTFDKWFEVNSYSTRPGYFNTIYTDVTQKKRAVEASEKSKAYLEYSLNSAPDGVLLIGPDLRFTYVNPAFTQLFGINAEEVLGKMPLELAPDKLSEKTARWIQEGIIEQMQSGKSKSGVEIELNHRDGSTIPASFSAAAIRDQQDRIIGEVVFLKNITERKRTQELMIQTEKMMSVGGLAAGMAHEINNPLGGMLQGTQNVIRRLSPDLAANRKNADEIGLDLDRLATYIKKRKIDQMLAGIIASGERAARIITNMLTFSRQSESNLCPNDINQLIDGVLELSANDYDLTKKYDFRKTALIKEYTPNLPLVPCTKTEIEQVILNLLKNAAHAMMETSQIRSPRILIRTCLEDQTVRIEVEDNGPGLNPEIQKRIFEPFFTTKPVGKGTGLGLSVSYMIITNNHKGSMEVTSQPGKGALFVIHLPLQHSLVT
ncbi:PAS domain S-box protein [bacterium]|nr:PAS domain S-box protein [bacterium]